MLRKKDKTQEPAENKAVMAIPKSVKVYKKGEKALPIIWRVDSVPEQRLRDKIGRDMAWEVAKSSVDFEREVFSFEIVRNIDMEKTSVTFAEAAKMYGWKTFKVEMNGQTIVPVWEDKGADEA